MCVLALAWRAHPQWLLVAAANRDEYHERPAEAMNRWPEPDHVIAGRDLQSGGTWLAISEQGRFGAITNLRGFGAPAAGAPSRGALVSDQVAGDGPYARLSNEASIGFNPFNLIVADADQARFWTNRPRPVQSHLAHGIYGLSNGMLDEPWPKTLRLKEIVLDWIVDGSGRTDLLIDGLKEERLPDVGLQALRPSDVPLEPPVSPIFIRHPLYGTRCSTVVLIDRSGAGVIIERRYDPDGEVEGEKTFGFSWPV